MAHKLNNTSKICFMTAGSIAITLIGLQIFFPSALYAIGHYNLILLIHKVIPGLFFISFTTNLAADYWNENKIITVQ